MEGQIETINDIIARALKALEDIPKVDWYDIYFNLNSWRWDDRLGDRPMDWDKIPNFKSNIWRTADNKRVRQKSLIIEPIMCHIRYYVPVHDLLAYYNLYPFIKQEYLNPKSGKN